MQSQPPYFLSLQLLFLLCWFLPTGQSLSIPRDNTRVPQSAVLTSRGPAGLGEDRKLTLILELGWRRAFDYERREFVLPVQATIEFAETKLDRTLRVELATERLPNNVLRPIVHALEFDPSSPRTASYSSLMQYGLRNVFPLEGHSRLTNALLMDPASGRGALLDALRRDPILKLGKGGNRYNGGLSFVWALLETVLGEDFQLPQLALDRIRHGAIFGDIYGKPFEARVATMIYEIEPSLDSTKWKPGGALRRYYDVADTSNSVPIINSAWALMAEPIIPKSDIPLHRLDLDALTDSLDDEPPPEPKNRGPSTAWDSNNNSRSSPKAGSPVDSSSSSSRSFRPRDDAGAG